MLPFDTSLIPPGHRRLETETTKGGDLWWNAHVQEWRPLHFRSIGKSADQLTFTDAIIRPTGSTAQPEPQTKQTEQENDSMGKKQKKSNKGRKPKTERKPKAEKSEVNGEAKQSAKAFIEELCNAGNTTKAEAIALVVEKYQVTEKAAKGAVNNCRHYQKKEGRPVGDWKKAEKPAKDNTAAA